MPSILDGLPKLCDDWLGIDSTWPGTRIPRYQSKSAFRRLCKDDPPRSLKGLLLMQSLYRQIELNWPGGPCRGKVNWRFEKQKEFVCETGNREVPLERTIAIVTDENWGNQVPTASGLGLKGTHAHHLDLVHRSGDDFTFFELKVDANNPVYAAFQLVQYGMVYAFSREHADQLGYKVDQLELLRAKQVQLAVLAPPAFYPDTSYVFLKWFEQCLNNGLKQFSDKLKQPPSSFRFEVFSHWSDWSAEEYRQEKTKKDVLKALVERQPLFGQCIS